MTYVRKGAGVAPASGGSAPTGAAGGDLSGTYPNPLVPGLANKASAVIPVAVKTANYTANANEFVPVNTTSNAVTITLATAPVDGTRTGIKLVIQGGTNAVTIACGGADVFNKAGGGTTLTLALLNQGIIVQYDAADGLWYVVGDDLPLGQLDARFASATDSRLTNARTPTAHASSHASGGSDAVTIAESQVTGLVTDLGTLTTNVATNTTAIATKAPLAADRTISAGGSTAAYNDRIVADTSSAAFAIALPAASAGQRPILITNIGANTLTLTGTVSGVTNPTLAQWSSRTIHSTASVLYFS